MRSGELPRKARAWGIFAALALASSPAAALDPAKALTQYGRDSYTTAQGLPQNSVLSLVQTRDGYLWLATYEGLVRFDGVRFTVFDKQNTPELTASWVTALFEDARGSLWVGTVDGLVERREGSFARHRLPNDSVAAITGDASGAVWVGTAGGGVIRMKGGEVTAFTAKEGLPGEVVTSVYAAKDGWLYVGTSDGGLGRIKEGAIEKLGKEAGYPTAAVLKMLEEPGGALWIATRGEGLFRRKDGAVKVFTSADGLPSEVVSDLLIDRDGSLFAGTSKGLARREGDRFAAPPKRDGAQQVDARVLLEDAEGSLWIGTEMAGMQRLKDGSFTTYSAEEGLPSDMVRSIYEDSAGSIWIATEGGGLAELAGGRVARRYTAEDKIGGDAVWGLFEDSEKTLWVGTFGGDLGRRRGGEFQVITRADGLPVDLVSSFAEHEGALWLGSDGLIRYKDGVFLAWGPERGVPKSRINCLLEDSKKTLWVCTASHGLGAIKTEREPIQFYTSKDGLAGDNAVAVTEDKDGVLWIATSGGLSRMKGGSLASFTRQQGLYDGAIHQVLVGDDGALWMSTNKGIFSVKKADIEAYEAKKIERIPSRSFGVADGMKNTECNGGTQPAGWKTRDGRLWFPTIAGAAVIDPKRIRRNLRPPPVYVESVVIDHVPHRAGEALEIAAGSKNLEIHYTALSLVNPSRVAFKYRLEGYDTEWNDAGPRRSAYYTNLPPGKYRFRVIASNDDGVWNEAGAGLSFYLRPRFYQTSAFLVLCVLAGSLVLGGAYRARVSYLKRRAKELLQHNAELAEALAAAREAARLKGEFVANMSHELRTPLNSIINIPDGLLGLFREQEVASCDRCASRFELEPGDAVSASTKCPECGEEGSLLVEKSYEFSGDGGSVVRYLTTIKRSGKHLQGIIDDVLDFSKLEAGKMAIELAPVLVKDLFEELAGTLAPLADQKQVTLNFDEDPPDLELLADPVKLSQILINLISNALKFSTAGDTIKIRADLAREDHACVFRVSDQGIGIAPEHQAVIFDSFYQVDGSHTRRAGGAGLGLAITKQLVELHGGTIWVESELGKGSSFFVKLPLEPELKPSRRPELLPRAARPPDQRVIVALDDEPVAIETLKLALRSADIECDVVGLTDPRKLESTVLAIKPDLLVLDIMLPRVSGLTLLRNLRASEATRDLPVLVVSAFHENREVCISLGSAWLGKPYQPEELAAAVRELLKRAPRRDAREEERA
jgi:signal transduction histidine kinase/ligand-binding sensor domain-containing protein/CheY-like chemotaxis protein